MLGVFGRFGPFSLVIHIPILEFPLPVSYQSIIRDFSPFSEVPPLRLKVHTFPRGDESGFALPTRALAAKSAGYENNNSEFTRIQNLTPKTPAKFENTPIYMATDTRLLFYFITHFTALPLIFSQLLKKKKNLPTFIIGCQHSHKMPYCYGYHDDNDYHSCFDYQPDSPFHIPAYNARQPPETHANYSIETPRHEYGNHGAYSGNERQPDQDRELDPWDLLQPTPYGEDQARRTVEYGLTPQELHKADQDCICEQTKWIHEE